MSFARSFWILVARHFAFRQDPVEKAAFLLDLNGFGCGGFFFLFCHF
jgi:hypothetical protein